METIYQNSYLNILLHRTTHNTLELQWLNFVPSADYRRSIEELMHLMRQYKALSLVADNRLLRALRQADLEWSGNLVFSGMDQLGAHRFAVVESLDAMNRMGINALVANVLPGTQITSRYFSTVEEARTWATAPY